MKRYFIFYLLMLANLVLAAQPVSVTPAEVKAVFLYNFTGFVDWPAAALPNSTEPLVIGVLGGNPFGTYLEDVVANEKKNGHPLVVKYYTRAEDIKDCHIVFINKQAEEQQKQTLALLKGRNILTVGDAPDFVKNGGMIRFFIENNKVRLQVNMEALKDANLVVSSKLLRVADIFNPQNR